MGDRDECRQCCGVWVVDHDCAGLGIDPLPQAGRIAGQGEHSSRAGLEQATAVDELPAAGAPGPPEQDRQPLHELVATDADPCQRSAQDQDGCGVGEDDAATEVEREHQHDRTEADDDELGAGQPE